MQRSMNVDISTNELEYVPIDFDDPQILLEHAKKLEGHTFREVLELGITPNGRTLEKADYNDTSFKGGMGTLIEERYFGYRANSDAHADFADAGVELKTTCYDVKNDGSVRAGERLVLGMIAFDESIEHAFDESHMWEKGGNILLIYYKRDKTIDKYDQRIEYVTFFTPPDEDLAIIREDYSTIQEYVMNGRADELSESMTHYLGACTKGATAEKSMRDQSVYAPGKKARGRAWCYKNSYMNVVLNDYIIGQRGSESIIKDSEQLSTHSFEEHVISLIEPFVGMTDREICDKLGLAYTGNKAQWTTIVYHMLGLHDNRADEFEKANISVRTVRIEERGSIVQSLSLDTFSFIDLMTEEWETAPLHEYFEETRFLFVAFQKEGESLRLRGATFWSMPRKDIDGPLRSCWQATKDVISNGVSIVEMPRGEKTRFENNLPSKTENPVAHVRPHTSKAAYRLEDGRIIGDIEHHADELPDGRAMTKQSFWLNNDYIYEIVRDI